MTRSSTTVCTSTGQPTDAKVSAAELATLIPNEPVHIQLAEVLGQGDASPWWGGQARSPGLNGRRQRREMQNHQPQERRCR
jgi:hypothetical protein